MNNNPLVSVIIPTYNRAEWLKEAINSVLNQSYEHIEILVIDDGSEEKIAELDILKNERIKYFRNENHGVAFSRNFGMKKSRGKYIAFLDSDDFWDKEKLKVQVQKLEDSEYKWSQHNYFYYDDRKQKVVSKINTYKYRYNYDKLQFCSFPVQTSCFMVDREAVLNNNCFFDESKTFGEDSEFYYKMIQLFPLQFIDSYLGYFRIRGNNAGKDIRKQLRSRVVFWNEHGKEYYVNMHMSRRVKFAYKWCVGLSNILGMSTKLKCICIYLLPWLLFKFESYCLKSEE